MVERLRSAFAAGDRDGFVALAGPALQTRAAVMYDNWREVAFVGLSHRPIAAGGPGELVVRWRAGEETLPAEHALALRLERGLLTDLSDEWRHAAVWGRRPVALSRAGGVSVVSALPARTDATLEESVWAAERLSDADLGIFAWDGSLVVEVPGDLLEFARMGRSSLSLDGVAAFSLSTTRESGYRVVLNPTLDLPTDDQRGVLLHEAVHAATRAMWREAPLWAAEGLAESVATSHWPAQSARNAGLVRAAASAVTAPPTDQELGAPGEGGAQAYALAEVAVEAMIARWGAGRAHAWVADWSASDRPEDAALTQTFRDALPA